MDEKNVVATPETPIDYKAEYEKQKARADGLEIEVGKQKSEKDKYAKECKAYQDEKKAQMTADEKAKQEQQEMLDKYKAMESEVAQMKLEKDLLANGFTTEESEKLIKGNFAVKDIAEIIKARVDSAVKSATAEFTKNSTSQSLMGKGSADGNAKSDFQMHQESKKKSNTIVELN